jgi:hypothetical protein
MCCKRRKLTHAEKAARRFDEYEKSVFFGVLASIVVLGLSAAVIAKAAGNAAMIWHIALVRSDTVALPALLRIALTD